MFFFLSLLFQFFFGHRGGNTIMSCLFCSILPDYTGPSP